MDKMKQGEAREFNSRGECRARFEIVLEPSMVDATEAVKKQAGFHDQLPQFCPFCGLNIEEN
jgi:hypothetical protein